MVKFVNNAFKVKEQMNEESIAWLYEASGELQAQVKRNTPTKGGWFTNIRNSWNYEVDESKLEARIGSPLQAAIWSEFGTGEYAIHGDGRKGYWVYVKGDGNPDADSKGGKSYTFEEAKKIVAMMKKDGLDAHMTKGQRPHRALQNAFDTLKKTLPASLKQRLKGLGQ